MFYDDHLPSHFHVEYNEFTAKIGIEDLKLIDGKLPSRVLGLAVEWASLHQKELEAQWERAVRKEKLIKIAPLE